MGFSTWCVLASLPGYFAPWGTDSDLHRKNPPQKVEKRKEATFLSLGMEQVIWFHQNILSPIDGPRSCYRPSSSQYMLLAIRQHGFLLGYLMGCDRLLRENEEPWVYRTAVIDGKIWKIDPPP